MIAAVASDLRTDAQKRYDEALRRSEELFRGLPERLPLESEEEWIFRCVCASRGGVWFDWRVAMAERASALLMLNALRIGGDFGA